MRNFFYRILCGFFLGISVFAPGFSGSIVAIAMGIYHDILRIISNPLKKLKQNLLFCLPVGIGVVVSAVLFVLTFRYLFDSYEKATYLLFIGLIAGNLPIVYMEVRKIGFKPIYLLGALGAFIAAVVVGVLAAGGGIISGSAASMSDWQGLVIGGLAAGVTALIPGMSISTVLILLGTYSPLIFAAEALLRSEFSYLVPIGLFILCTLVGLMATAKGIKYIFKKYPGFANTTVLGFLCGSLLSVMYQSHNIVDPSFNWFIGGIMIVVGVGISALFILLGRFMNKSEPNEELE